VVWTRCLLQRPKFLLCWSLLTYLKDNKQRWLDSCRDSPPVHMNDRFRRLHQDNSGLPASNEICSDTCSRRAKKDVCYHTLRERRSFMIQQAKTQEHSDQAGAGPTRNGIWSLFAPKQQRFYLNFKKNPVELCLVCPS
jgi:hypothetical protein